MTAGSPLGLFDAIGIEIEHMIVQRGTLAVRPIADELLKRESGRYQMEVERGTMSWSNELALHVIELKTTEPVRDLVSVDHLFQDELRAMQRHLDPMDACLLPTGMHPWMDPHQELRLWPHDHSDIYAALNRIFDCRGHGWANLQSVHVNLPFANDEEFGLLHAAIRVILPLLPALAASSPASDGRLTGLMDTRLDTYRHNADRVPSVAGLVIPEAVFTRADYEDVILNPIYRDVAPLDTQGLLRHEWINSRGAIARFDRMAIEIRVLDVQESPFADLAVLAAVVSVVRAATEGRWLDPAALRTWPESTLSAIFLQAIRDGDQALIHDQDYLALFGYRRRRPCRMRDLWDHLIDSTLSAQWADAWRPWYATYSHEGCLARRISDALGETPSRDRLLGVYQHLAHCLADGGLFHAGDC
jgi:gamma-glutamyl:cysteine ligase YbdK (ATP-grasp superfamily)